MKDSCSHDHNNTREDNRVQHPTCHPRGQDNVIAALTAGFSDDAIISGYVFTDSDTYAFYAGGYFACYTDFAIEYGYVWTTGDGIGAVVAMPFQAWQHSQHDAALKDRMIQATGPYAEQAFVLDAALTERHPRTSDHLYLAFIAVTPQHHGQGIGTLMLRELFDLADQLQLPIYGEASSERNSRLYTRIGMPPHDGPALSLPGAATQILPFWRPAPQSSPLLRPMTNGSNESILKGHQQG